MTGLDEEDCSVESPEEGAVLGSGGGCTWVGRRTGDQASARKEMIDVGTRWEEGMEMKRRKRAGEDVGIKEKD